MSNPSVLFAWTALALSIVMGSLAQITLKHAMNCRSSAKGRKQFIPLLALWLAMFGGTTICWVVALKKLDISYAYPMLSMGYVIVTALAAWLLREKVSQTRWMAVGLISIGAAIVAGSI